MARRIGRLSVLLAVIAAATVVSTWPLADRSAWTIPSHQDPLFSTWRLYQWTRNLFGAGPGGLADGNIFYPASDVLFYSDAILLPALAAAPFIQAGVPPLLVYDALIWASFLTAGLGMYLFARDLSGSRAGALVAAVIFTGAPYRIEHIFHLELLWTCWIPLAFWAARRLLAGESRAARWLAAACIGQFLCCVYYGLFLLTVLPLVALVAWAMRPAPLSRAVMTRLAAAMLIVVAVVGAYALPYSRVRQSLGDRDTDEIVGYGATPQSYLAAPPGNWLWGWTAYRLGDREKRLSAGLAAYVLAAPALLPPIQPWTAGLLVGTAFAFEASRGLDGYVYPLLHRFVSPYGGLRVPARFAVMVLAGIAALAALGVARIERELGHPRWSVVLAVACVGVLLAEYATVVDVRAMPRKPPSVYAWLAQQPPTVIAHMPMPAADALPGPEADFQYFAQYHHHRLVNGNSGYYPRTYLRLLAEVRNFPDARALAALRERGVTLVILHSQFYSHGVFEHLVLLLQDTPGVEDLGELFDDRGRARVFRLLPE